MSGGIGYALTDKGRAALAELRERYEITREGRAALAESGSISDPTPETRCVVCGAWLEDEARCSRCGRAQ